MDNQNGEYGSGYGNSQNNMISNSGYNQYEQQEQFSMSGYSPNNISNNYNQPQNYSQNNFGQSNYNQQQNYTTKPRKVKRKKKHRFLKFIIFNAVLFGLIKLNGWYVQQSFDKFVLDYPFVSFENETDSPGYITGNFNLYDYKTEINKNVTWRSTSKYISIKENGSVEVTRPDKESEYITITCTYKFLFGKAIEKYDITVVSSNTQNPEDFTVITKADLENQIYDRNMKATLDENGSITSMYGDFKDTYIYNAEDGIAWIEAYRATLDLDDNCEFACYDTNSSDRIKTFNYVAYYNGIKDNSQTIVLSVDTDTFELFNINCEIKTRNKNINTDNLKDNLDYQSIVKTYINSNNLGVELYDIFNEENIIYTYKGRDYVVHKLDCQTDAGTYKVYIDLETGAVINVENTAKSITGTGKDELGNNKKFVVTKGSDLDKLLGNHYFMADTNRNITTYRQNGPSLYIRMYHKSGQNPLLLIPALEDALLGEILETMVKSSNTKFKDEVAISAYTNIIKAYDWYKDELGIVSYDGKGAPIVINVNDRTTFDNACWNCATLEFSINAAKKLKYTCGSDTAVLGHEYTHAVFMDLTSNINVSQEDNPSIAQMNEGYADIFGHLIAGSKDWCIGKNKDKDGNDIVFRDSANFNSAKVYRGTKYPTQWHGENWDDEEHIGSVIISHVGWEMYNDKDFTNSDIANIWYDSLVLGYTNASDFVSVRRNVIKAMDNRGYSKELQDKVAIWFDEVAVYDDQYVLTTTDNSVEGDILLDNTTSRRYVVITSILGSFFGDCPVYIYEETDKINDDEVRVVNDMLKSYIDSYYSDTTTMSGNKIKIEYKQASKSNIDLLEKFVASSRSHTSKIMHDAVGGELDAESESLFKSLLNLCIMCEVVENTPYEFYDGLGIELSEK